MVSHTYLGTRSDGNLERFVQRLHPHYGPAKEDGIGILPLLKHVKNRTNHRWESKEYWHVVTAGSISGTNRQENIRLDAAISLIFSNSYRKDNFLVGLGEIGTDINLPTYNPGPNKLYMEVRNGPKTFGPMPEAKINTEDALQYAIIRHYNPQLKSHKKLRSIAKLVAKKLGVKEICYLGADGRIIDSGNGAGKITETAEPEFDVPLIADLVVNTSDIPPGPRDLSQILKPTGEPGKKETVPLQPEEFKDFINSNNAIYAAAWKSTRDPEGDYTQGIDVLVGQLGDPLAVAVRTEKKVDLGLINGFYRYNFGIYTRQKAKIEIWDSVVPDDTSHEPHKFYIRASRAKIGNNDPKDNEYTYPLVMEFSYRENDQERLGRGRKPILTARFVDYDYSKEELKHLNYILRVFAKILGVSEDEIQERKNGKKS